MPNIPLADRLHLSKVHCDRIARTSLKCQMYAAILSLGRETRQGNADIDPDGAIMSDSV